MSRVGRRVAIGALVTGSLVLAACADPGGDDSDADPQAGITTVTFRLWDEAAATAYRESFDAFTAANRDVHVEVEVVPWESYWSQLEADMAAGTPADIFWTNTANVEGYADDGLLVSMDEVLDRDAVQWQPAVVDLYTHDDQLWGVPQLWDAVALYYNADLVEEAGIDPTDLTWAPPPAPEPAPDPTVAPEADAAAVTVPAAEPAAEPAGEPTDEPADDAEPAAPADTLLPAAQQLTVDTEGRTAADEDFNPEAVARYGFNAEPELQSVLLPFLAQAGAEFQTGDELGFGSPEGVAAVQYLVDLVTVHHVAPPAEVTAGVDATLEMFLDGRLALFQSGSYHLRQIATEADFTWGIAPVVAGPAGQVSIVHGVVAAAHAGTADLTATTKVLDWIGSADGQLALAGQGIALPGVVDAEPAFLDHWGQAGVDVSPFLDAAAGELTPPPAGPGMQAAIDAIAPVFHDAFRGDLPVPDAVDLAVARGDAALASD
ncbi:ABC transporter substrate-binding protein [Georgenia sp. MJ170]|uniref:ABC transporter substrate-binding protein n=1 Tax=Georgenia sunbinii TaxID=3117728 RepID=UPI002F2636BC